MPEPGSVDRRRFLQRVAALIGGPAGAALAAGCGGVGGEGGPGNGGPPPGEGSLAAVVTWGRIQLDMLWEYLEAAVIPTPDDVVALLRQVNEVVAETHAKAARSGAGDLRINVDPTMEEVVSEELDARALPLRFPGGPPRYTVQRLASAQARAEAILAGRGAIAEWSLWAFLAFLAVLHPEFDDATLLGMARKARRNDLNDVAGEVYSVLVMMPPGTATPLVDLDREVVEETSLLVYQALGPHLAGETGTLLGVLLPVLLLYAFAVATTIA